MQDTGFGAEPYDDFWDAEQEGLDPEFEELALVLEHVSFGFDFGGCFEFDPVDGVVFVVGLAVPD